MSPLTAVRTGIRRVNNARALLFGVYLTTLLVALPLSIALRGMIEAHLGRSLAADTALSHTNHEWWQEFSAQASGLGTTFTPSIVGFGAVLENVSNLLDNVPLATTVAGATTAWLVIWSFLTGGIIDRLARDRKTRSAGFFAACGMHFWRLLRLGVIALLVYYVLFETVHAWIFEDAYEWIARDMDVERTAFLTQLAGYALFGLLLLFFNVIFDYARIRIVVEDRRSALGAVAAAARFVRRHLRPVAGVYTLAACVYLLAVVVYGILVPGAPRDGLSMWGVLIAGQIYILARHYVKLLFYASQAALFQSALAHAAYTAAPPLVWPESPAAEAVTNREATAL
jgi:hypothetical protein